MLKIILNEIISMENSKKGQNYKQNVDIFINISWGLYKDLI